MSASAPRPNAGGHRGERPGPPRIPAEEVRATAQWVFGAIGSGKQMAQALGVHPVDYRAAISEDRIPRAWEARIRALQDAHRASVPPRVRVALGGAYAGCEASTERLRPAIEAFADKAEAEGTPPRDVAVALLTIGALRLVRVR